MVQKGGNMYLERFESFDEKQSCKSSIKQLVQQNEDESHQIHEKKSSSKFLRNILDQDFQYSEEMKPFNIFDLSYPDQVRFERLSKIQDSQFNHSKIVRHLENDLNILMVDYNLSKIIQMSLHEKIELLKKTQTVRSFQLHQRNELQKQKSLQDMNKVLEKSMLSESDSKINKKQIEQKIKKIRNRRLSHVRKDS